MAVLTTDQVVEELNQCLSPLFHSMAQYLLDSGPFVTDKDKDSVKALEEIARADARSADELTQLIENIEGIPQPGLPDPLLAELNYLSFPYILDALIRERRRRMEEQKKRLELFERVPKAHELMKKLQGEMESQVKKLAELREKKYSNNA